MLNKQLSAVIHLFVMITMMVTFSWIGLADFNWSKVDTLDRLPKQTISKEQLPATVLDAIRILHHSSAIESRQVGAGGAVSDYYTAFKQLLLHPAAESAFEYMLQTDNVVAKIYALHGLKHLNQTRYQQLIPFYYNSNYKVRQRMGCSGSYEAVTEALDFLNHIHPIAEYSVNK